MEISELQMQMSKVKLLALDVDGILTDGGLYYTESGEVCKKFNVKDGKGIHLLMQAGIEVAVISADDSPATKHRAKKLGITHCFIGVEDKISVLQHLCQKLNLSLSQVAYMGDDLNDLPVLKAVGFPLTVADAIPENKQVAVYVTRLAGGTGAVREVCNLFLNSIVTVC
jgi:3-deoxy-D-manno-octulosonate 8-phosphate phosphatase (KDO 8-P phosphatase)